MVKGKIYRHHFHSPPTKLSMPSNLSWCDMKHKTKLIPSNPKVVNLSIGSLAKHMDKEKPVHFFKVYLHGFDFSNVRRYSIFITAQNKCRSLII
ncbi:Hypothetical predicted protein [Octopus vulgaris]|uniref:Uncharacterized protein n=1 Tax=Octopus vulgaris TaxID=6645 RepID=A0AA36F154_OCTVU|nr:Hypothetical predicted protein [Octopus vulgaris]